VSTVESGQLNISALDMFEIAAALEDSVEDLYTSLTINHKTPPRLLRNIVNELTSHLPNQSPMYLQRDAGNPDAAQAVDYVYSSAGSMGSLFDQSGRKTPYDLSGTTELSSRGRIPTIKQQIVFW
jgi:hypothetical protein